LTVLIVLAHISGTPALMRLKPRGIFICKAEFYEKHSGLVGWCQLSIGRTFVGRKEG
jgi:hypothetical protein